MITTIQILNFRNIKELQAKIGHLNVIDGDSGAGKSTFLDAIIFAITGKASEDDIRNGENYAEVTILFDDYTSICRKRTHKGTEVSVNDSKCTVEAAKKFIEDKFNCSMEIIKAVCGSDFLKNLSPKDFTSFLLSILPIQVSIDKLIEFIKDMSGDIMPDGEDELRKRISKGTILDIKGIANLCAELKEERKVLKRSLAELEVQARFDDSSIPPLSKEEIQVEIGNINLAKSRASEYVLIAANYNKAIENRQRAISRKAEIEAEIERLGGDKEEPDRTARDAAEEQKKMFVDAFNKCTISVQTCKMTIDKFQRDLENLDKPICPLSVNLVCMTDKTVVKAEITQLLEANRNELKKLEGLLPRINSEISFRDDIIRKYDDEYNKFLTITSLRKQINEIIIPDEPEKPIEMTIDLPDERLSELNAYLSTYSAYDIAKQYKKVYDEMYQRFEVIAYLVSVLEVKAVQAFILEKAVKPFADIINERANRLLRGFKFEFDCSDGLKITVIPGKDKLPTPLHNISTGEFLNAAFLIMCCINEITGVPILMLDNTNDLDTQKICALHEQLKNCKQFKNIFVAGIDHMGMGSHTTGNHISL